MDLKGSMSNLQIYDSRSLTNKEMFYLGGEGRFLLLKWWWYSFSEFIAGIHRRHMEKIYLGRLPWPLHWWWLLKEPSYGGLRGMEKSKSWQVIYQNAAPPNNVSVPMCYGNAVDYADMFGGGYKIQRVRSEK